MLYNRTMRALLCQFCTVILCLQASAFADDEYKQILKSRELAAISSGSRKDETPTGFRDGPWFKANSDFASIFLRPLGQLQLIWWSAPPLSRYKEKKEADRGVSKIFASAFVTYREKGTKRDLDVSVYVPHPSYIEMVRSGVVPELAALIPPPSKLQKAEKITVNGIEAEAYWKMDDSCALLVRLPRDSFLQIASPGTCYKFEDLKTLLSVMNIQKLKRKLEN